MNEERRVTVVEHLAELRRRVIASLLATMAGMVVAYYFYDPWILNMLRAPLDSLSRNAENPFVPAGWFLRFLIPENAAAGPLNLHFIDPMEAFLVRLKASLLAGLILASPFVFYQIWAFVAEGLTRAERKAVRYFLPASLALFLLGVLTAYAIVLPMALYFLIITSGKGLVAILTLGKYATVVVACALVFGLVFQLPIIILFLTRLGLVTPDFLARKRRYVIVLVFVAAAVLTPPDVVSQVLMAVPMLLLYEVSIVAARVMGTRKRQPEEAHDA